MTNLLTYLSTTQLEQLLNFTSSYGIVLMCLGLILGVLAFIKDFKSLIQLFIYFSLTEIFVYFFVPIENIHINLFYFYCKLGFMIYMLLEIKERYTDSKEFVLKSILLIIMIIFTSALSFDSIMIKSLGKIHADTENQYGLDYQKRLIKNTAFYQIRLEVYNQQNNFVKVIHSTGDLTINQTINLIEDKKDFWNLSEKFLKIEDIKK